MAGREKKTSYINTRRIDEDIALLEELLQEEMYEKSEKSLYQFLINFWGTFESATFKNSWYLNCLCDHAQAAVQGQIRRLCVTIPPRSCLPSNSSVLLSNASYIPIKDIEPGMVVKSSDGKKIVNNKVLAKWNTGVKPCYEIITSDNTRLEVSKDHRIYTYNGFKTVLELNIGERLIKYQTGLIDVYVTKIEYIGELECYDIEVENESTFFAEDILVHNSKSIVHSIILPTWTWINQPHQKIWLLSHGSKLFIQNIMYARKILTHPLYKNRWCDPGLEDHFRFTLADDSNTKSRVDNSSGGYLIGGSPTSGALGLGYNIAILDDILDSEASKSLLEIENVNSFYDSTFLNRSNDVNTDVVIIVMQRLHNLDLCNHVTNKYKEQGWFILNLPAKYEPERTFISPIGFNDRRTRRNELLDPQRLPDEFLAQQQKNPLIYNTRYQQNPEATAEGNLVKDEWLQESAKKPVNYTAMMTIWDLSFTDAPESTYTVGLVMAKYEDEFHIIDMYRRQLAIPEQVDAIIRLKKKYPKSIIGIEKKANGHAAMSLLNREIKDIYAFEPRMFGGSKEQRFNAILPYLRDKKLFIYSPFTEDDSLESTYSVNEIKKEVKSFPLGANNDIVDCLSYGVQWLAEYGALSEGMITKGQKIMISEDDYQGVYRSKVYNIYNPYNFFDEDFIPSREDLNSINW